MKEATNRNKKRAFSYAKQEDPLWQRVIIRTVERLSGGRQLQRIYDELYDEQATPFEVWSSALRKIDIQVDYPAEQLAKVPRRGPVIFVANHPFGVLDGLILLDIVTKVRTDFFLLINEILADEPLVKGHLLPVDFRTTKEAIATNLATRQATTERLRAGEALAIFPSGGVATAPKIRGRAEEFPWRKFIASKIHETQCTVVPIYFHGQNSRLFHAISKVSMHMRLGLLLYEVTNKKGQTIRVEIGEPIPYTEMEKLKNRQQLIDYLYQQTMKLGQ